MSLALTANDVVGGYRIEGEMARGGMGIVYRASHAILSRRAAIKVLHSDMLGTSMAKERMLQEARILESIDHETVVKVYDVGLLPDGRPWLAMELVEGQSLGDHLLVRRQLLPLEAARIVSSVADALLRSHAAGVVHRDIKPDNIMLTPGEDGVSVKVIDWGIAHTEKGSRRLTERDFSPGTPCYMPPEQLRGGPIDASADVYALGAVAWEMLVGDPPFDGENSLEIAIKTINDPVPSLHVHLDDVPDEVERTLRAMLAKEPSGRPALEQVRAVFRAWAQLLDDEYAEMSLEIEMESDFEYTAQVA